MIEGLAYDKYKKPSSQAVIKSGPNRGSRLPEKDGVWICMSGHSEYSRSQEQAINYEWSKKLIALGCRIGKIEYDGCTNFYIFKKVK